MKLPNKIEAGWLQKSFDNCTKAIAKDPQFYARIAENWGHKETAMRIRSGVYN